MPLYKGAILMGRRKGQPIVKYMDSVHELCKTAEPIEMPFAEITLVGPRKHVPVCLLDGGAHWRRLANMTEPSTCGGDAAFSSCYFDRCYLFVWCAYSDDPAAAATCPPSQEVYTEGTIEAASDAEEIAADFRPDDDDAR